MATKPFDPSEFLDSSEAVEAYLSAAFESDDASVIADALGVVARAKGMTELASADPRRLPLVAFMEGLRFEGLDLARETDQGRDVDR